MAHSFQRKLDRFPPVLCRLLAVRYPQGRRGMPIALTDEEIMQRGSIAIADFMWLSYSTSWAEIPEAKKNAFLKGCGIRLDNWRSYSRLVRQTNRGAWRHVKSSPLYETVFSKLLSIYHGRTKSTA